MPDEQNDINNEAKNWDISNVKSMDYIFEDCSLLKNLLSKYTLRILII